MPPVHGAASYSELRLLFPDSPMPQPGEAEYSALWRGDEFSIEVGFGGRRRDGVSAVH